MNIEFELVRDITIFLIGIMGGMIAGVVIGVRLGIGAGVCRAVKALKATRKDV